MNNREQFNFYKENGFIELTEEKNIEHIVNALIKALYIPVHGFDGFDKVDEERIKHFEIDDSEPINWGDLKCCSVEKMAENSYAEYEVIIDEAAPGECQTFCDYIQKYMNGQGWSVHVETEW
jgi:hypothetical protein